MKSFLSALLFFFCVSSQAKIHWSPEVLKHKNPCELVLGNYDHWVRLSAESDIWVIEMSELRSTLLSLNPKNTYTLEEINSQIRFLLSEINPFKNAYSFYYSLNQYPALNAEGKISLSLISNATDSVREIAHNLSPGIIVLPLPAEGPELDDWVEEFLVGISKIVAFDLLSKYTEAVQWLIKNDQASSVNPSNSVAQAAYQTFLNGNIHSGAELFFASFLITTFEMQARMDIRDASMERTRLEMTRRRNLPSQIVSLVAQYKDTQLHAAVDQAKHILKKLEDPATHQLIETLKISPANIDTVAQDLFLHMQALVRRVEELKQARR